FEQKSLIEVSDGSARVVAVGEADLNAWRRHISDGTTVRMRALEDGTTAELSAGRLTPAMAVARAHMEVAGLAAFCCRKLYDAGRTRDFTRLMKLLKDTYFGSSMRIQVKGTPELNEYLRPEEGRPLGTGELIKAMDDFRASGDEPGTRCQMTYGLLSEFAHPAMRASSTFAEVLSEHETGWYIQYREEDRLGEQSARMALEILLDNMRIGHGSAALLNLAGVVQKGATFLLRTPSPDEVGDVYEHLLQQPPDGSTPA
ncbi:MAG TPA: hypothetical protein VM841_08585, partial [Actinomycetota bacterium]|nr:hypothetical protein [Actinomycetota bacterium]